ncbi:unnamed protein product [Prorocentrum cordatum]|uniref:Uncharacterized protein n=1 Tax=Prorocentrum cordatum TaxID=2364126 RepID=A0ABN9PWY3_9DINO|nr:unnamed protein product [Polarella glacialis]
MGSTQRAACPRSAALPSVYRDPTSFRPGAPAAMAVTRVWRAVLAAALAATTALSLAVTSEVAHHPTAAAACSTCKSYYPDAACSAGDCGDGSGEYCWCPSACPNFTPC